MDDSAIFKGSCLVYLRKYSASNVAQVTRNLSAECSGIFFTTKDTNDPKKFHGMNNKFPQ